ncbi:hypothetical protein [Enterobacter cloacae]|uniref:hypothetical protein n=1 Tax=Enterobacter cloacae TaxID=550 RepID=UPI002FFC5432
MEEEIRALQKSLPVHGAVFLDDLRKAAASVFDASSVEVKPAVSNSVGTKCFILTSQGEPRHVVAMQANGHDARVLSGEERIAALSNHTDSHGETGVDVVLTAARDFVLPLDTGASLRMDYEEACTKTREQMALGAAKIERVLADRAKLSGRMNENVLFVGCEDFFGSADIALNHCAPVEAAYQAISDYLVPLSQRYPNVTIAAGSIYISSAISKELRSTCEHLTLLQDGKKSKVNTLVNFTANVMPVLRDGRLLTLVRKGNHLMFRPDGGGKRSLIQPHVLSRIDRALPSSGKLLVSNYREDSLDDDLRDGKYQGTCFLGKTLLPGEPECIEAHLLKHFDPSATVLTTELESQLFSHEFMVGGEKFLAILCGEFRDAGSGGPSEARLTALPNGEDLDNAVRYDWIIHPTVGGDVDDTLLNTAFHYVHSDFGGMNKAVSHTEGVVGRQHQYAKSDDLVSFTYEGFSR